VSELYDLATRRFLTKQFVEVGLGAELLKNEYHPTEIYEKYVDETASSIELLRWLSLGKQFGYFTDVEPWVVDSSRERIFRGLHLLSKERFPKDYLAAAERLSIGKPIDLRTDVAFDDRALVPVFQASMVLARGLTEGLVGIFLRALRARQSPLDDESAVVASDAVMLALYAADSWDAIWATDPLATYVAGMIELIDLLCSLENLFPEPPKAELARFNFLHKEVTRSNREVLKFAVSDIVGWRLPIGDRSVLKRYWRAFNLLQGATEDAVLKAPNLALVNLGTAPFEAVQQLTNRYFGQVGSIILPPPPSPHFPPPGGGGFGTERGEHNN
jgi:hypothetical protein